MRDRIARRTGVAVISAALVGVMALPAMAGGSGRVPFAGAVPRWATSANLKGAAPASSTMTVQVVLGWRNAQALSAVFRSVPAGAHYSGIPARPHSDMKRLWANLWHRFGRRT